MRRRRRTAHPTREAHLEVEYPGCSPATGKELQLVGKPPTGRVHQVDHGQQTGIGSLEDADLLLDGRSSPRARLHRGIVSDDRDDPAVNPPCTCQHAIGGQSRLERSGEQAVLDERALVEKELQPLAHG